MARPRQFDEEQALESAMRTFWASGYDATSTQDLCDATGLSRGSIYNTFKSKYDLFERSLLRYMEHHTSEQVALVESEGPVRPKLWSLVERVIDDETGDRLGCLVVNSTIELAHREPRVAAHLRRDHRLRVDAIAAAIDRDRRNGVLEPGRDSRLLAEFVVGMLGGLRLSARSGADRATLKEIAGAALDTL